MITIVALSSLLYLLIVTYSLFMHRFMLPISAPFLGLFMSSIVLSLGYWYRETSHRKSLEINLKDAYENLQRTNDRLEVEVDKRTSELKEKNSELEIEIGERKRIEQNFSRKSGGIDQCKRKTYVNISTQGSVLANMSHELRTPLNVIFGRFLNYSLKAFKVR